jgi:outer membrane PBP1 activator LpoA protein
VLTAQTLHLAEQYQNGLDEARLQGALLVRKRLADARLALLNQNPQAALAALPTFLDTLAPELEADILETRARALLASNWILLSINTRLILEKQLRDPARLQSNRLAIWTSLNQATNQQIREWLQQSTDPNLKGWLELAYIDKNSPTQLSELQQMLGDWKQRFADHSAAAVAIPLIFKDWQEMQFHPKRIAVFLPFSGKYNHVANAIMAGISTAYYQDDASGMSLTIYDLGGQAQNVPQTYAQAIAEGADAVIGPLDKSALSKLMQLPELSIPVLSLNYADSTPEPQTNLYQFGLLPEDEAKQVAERAILDEHLNAVVFAPSGTWGSRLSSAFAERFETLGGTLLTAEYYDPNNTDYSDPIRRALLLDESVQRYKTLRQTLRRPIKFEPSRRQDVDMVFVVAWPRQGRQLRPQFKFHFASDLPVYATSHIYSGTENPSADQDINGVVFCDMPWNLKEINPQEELRMKVEQLFPEDARQLPKLTALGIDAYHLLPNLKRLSKQPHQRYAGLTGNLSVDGSNRVYRQLNWARFEGGRPRVINPEPEAEVPALSMQ